MVDMGIPCPGEFCIEKFVRFSLQVHEFSKGSKSTRLDPFDYRKKEMGIEVCMYLVSIGSSRASEILNFSIR